MTKDKKMKILHVYRSVPDDNIKKLVTILSRDREADEFKLYEPHPDYDKLVDMIFQADQTVSWW